MFLGQIAAGVGTATNIPLTFVPQYLYWNNATTLQAIRVMVEGDGVIVDLDTAGIDAFAATAQPGRVANGFYLPLSNGFIPGKNVTIIATNGVAAAIDLYGFSLDKPATRYIQSLMQNVLANSGISVSDFMMVGLPNAITVTDFINIEFQNGLVQRFDVVDLLAMNGFYQNSLVAAQTYLVNNLRGNVKRLDFTPALAQNIYKMSAKLVGNVSGLANY